ncbi:unnamed protein product [Orchesella dallaii]|uniref:Uncharacterized protein n=1 Tax=Orchesella dallaii TaxID=48710 RepID=A0ABP1QEQ3_9HEXA
MVTIFATVCSTGYVPPSKIFIKSVKRGNISVLIRSLQMHPHLKAEYSTYFQKTYENTTPNSKFPTVRNLEEYLAPFSQCLVHVTNVQNVDFQQQSVVPIIVRHHTPAKVIDTQFCRKECLIWLPPAINVTGEPLTMDSGFDCPLSKYIKDSFITTGLCSSMDRWNFALNIRPWNCQVTVALFPPLYIYAARYFNSYEWRHILPIDHFNSLRFVSCGRPKETGLPFEKLINEFDWEIWIWLLVCLGSLVFLVDSDVITKQSFGLKVYMQNNLNRLQFHSKVLVEQGSAYLAAPYMSRITQAIFLLVAIVISNAYKGENVFQLISNRQVIPYRSI